MKPYNQNKRKALAIGLYRFACFAWNSSHTRQRNIPRQGVKMDEILQDLGKRCWVIPCP